MIISVPVHCLISYPFQQHILIKDVLCIKGDSETFFCPCLPWISISISNYFDSTNNLCFACDFEL